MKISKLITITAAMSASALLVPSLVTAQDATPAPAPSAAASPAPATTTNNGDNTQGNRRGGNNNNGDFRQRMNDRMKTELKATDDEWAVIQPLIEKVLTLRMQSGGFGGFGGGGPGGNRRNRGENGGGDQTASANATPQTSGSNAPRAGGGFGGGSPETQALRDALSNDSTSIEDIKAKLQAVRDARKKANTDLAQAREDLKKVLTMRQEATLVNMGILE